MIEVKTTYFENTGKGNTDETFTIARKRAEELGIKTIVIASTRGETAIKAVEAFQGFRMIIVTHAVGMYEPNADPFSAENRKTVEGKGGIILTTTHALAGLSRAVRNKYNTPFIGDWIADTLRMFGQGMKVVCEIAAMAADSGLVKSGEDVISIAGSARGADTAVVITPANVTRFFDIKVREIICKPRL